MCCCVCVLPLEGEVCACVCSLCCSDHVQYGWQSQEVWWTGGPAVRVHGCLLHLGPQQTHQIWGRVGHWVTALFLINKPTGDIYWFKKKLFFFETVLFFFFFFFFLLLLLLKWISLDHSQTAFPHLVTFYYLPCMRRSGTERHVKPNNTDPERDCFEPFGTNMILRDIFLHML